MNITSDNEDKSRQRTLNVPQSAGIAVELMDEADQISRVHLIAAAKRASGFWLHALPTPHFGRF